MKYSQVYVFLFSIIIPFFGYSQDMKEFVFLEIDSLDNNYYVKAIESKSQIKSILVFSEEEFELKNFLVDEKYSVEVMEFEVPPHSCYTLLPTVEGIDFWSDEKKMVKLYFSNEDD